MAKNTASAPRVKKRPRFLTTLLALVIAVSAVVDGFCIYDVYGRDVKGAQAKAAEQSEGDDADDEAVKLAASEREAQKLIEARARQLGKVDYTPVTPMLALDSTQAVGVLKSIAGSLGINNVDEEYQVKETKERGNYRYFIMQQVHKSIPVYGSTVTVAAEKEGQVVNVSGSHIEIPEDAETEPEVLIDEAKKKVDAYVQNELKIPSDDYYLESGGVVYDPVSKDNAVLAYQYAVFTTDSKFLAVIMVDAKTGEAFSCFQRIDHEMITLDQPALPNLSPKGQEGKPLVVDVYKNSDDSYVLLDDNNYVQVYLHDRTDKVFDSTDISSLNIYSYNPNKETPDASAVDALYNFSKVSRFYNETFSREGLRNDASYLPIYVGINDFYTHNFQDNAAMCGGNQYMIIGTRTGGEAEYSAHLDVMGHEFTHGVINTDSTISERAYDSRLGQDYYYSAQSGIHEGLADVFGEFAQDYTANGVLDNDTDWKNDVRDMTSPSLDDYADYTEFSTEGHAASFLVSYPVYLSAKTVPAPALAQLYYDLIPTLNGFSDFVEIRSTIEKNAVYRNTMLHIRGSTDASKEINDESLEAIIDSFDAIGTPTFFSRRVEKGGKVIVYDSKNKPYSNYNIKIARLYDEDAIAGTATDRYILNEDVKSDSFTLPSDMGAGVYTFIITDLDKKGGSEYSFEVMVNDNSSDSKAEAYPDTVKFFTEFGAKQREVVLTLDVSGSMYGDPIEQTKIAAVKFVDTVLTASPSTKISIVTYSGSASTVIERSNDKNELISIINGLGTGGGTNIYDGLSYASDILESSDASNKMIVLMSDGYPNEGKSEGGDYATPCIDKASSIKSDGSVLIYSLGFYHEMDEYEKQSCQALMSAIASDGYYFEVNSAEDTQFSVDDPENELYQVFNDLAGQINGDRYIYIRIACPVDVVVRFGGQILSSASKTFNTRTDFGTLSFDKEKEDEKGDEDESDDSSGSNDEFEDAPKKSSGSGDDEVKVLRLLEGNDYEICISGTGKGKMDYTISYPNEDGDYKDVRSFKKIPITKDTLISTSTAKGEETEMNVDSDGDGVFDLVYKAKEDSKAVLQNRNFKLIMIIALSAIIAVLVIAEIILVVKRYKYNQVCHSCGAKLANAKKFCNNCGAKAVRKNLILPQKIERPKQSRGVVITKLVFIALFGVTAGMVLYLYTSPATTVYKQLSQGKPSSAQEVYETAKVEDSTLQSKYLAFVLNHYIDKAGKAKDNGKYTDDEFRTLLNGAVSLDNDDITDKAEEYLDELGEAEEDSKNDESSSEDESSDIQDA